MCMGWVEAYLWCPRLSRGLTVCVSVRELVDDEHPERDEGATLGERRGEGRRHSDYVIRIATSRDS